MKLPHIALADIADIILTAYFVYAVLLLIRGTRAMQILQGLALLLVLRAGAQYFHLWTVFSLLNALLIVSGVAIPVVFQPELRRALAQLGRAGFQEAHSVSNRESVERLCAVLERPPPFCRAAQSARSSWSSATLVWMITWRAAPKSMRWSPPKCFCLYSLRARPCTMVPWSSKATALLRPAASYRCPSGSCSTAAWVHGIVPLWA